MEFEYAFPDGMEQIAGTAFTGVAGVVLGVVMILYLLLLGLCIVCYVLNAAGLYQIAKRRGIHHAWLAWIPIGVNWLLGSISDHYQYVVKQKVTKRRKILLTLSIVMVAMLILLGAGMTALILSDAAVAAIALVVIAYLAMLGLAIAITVFCYIAYFDLFRSCRPEQDVLFLVLGIFFNIVLAFFVFACRNHDKGMPERKVKQPEPILVEPEAEIDQEEESAAEAEAPVEEEIPVVETQIVEDPEE